MTEHKNTTESVNLERLTQRQAAYLLGTSTRAIRGWKCPRNSDGSYRGPELVGWYVNREAGTGGSLTDERRRLLRLKADAEQFNQDRRRKLYIARAEVIRNEVAIWSWLSSLLARMAYEIPQLLRDKDSSQYSEVINAYCARVREEIRSDDGNTDDDSQ